MEREGDYCNIMVRREHNLWAASTIVVVEVHTMRVRPSKLSCIGLNKLGERTTQEGMGT